MVTSPFRVLVIDDNASIHEDFRRILAPPEVLTAPMDDLEALIFGEAKSAPAMRPRFEVVSAMQGREGHAQLLAAKNSQNPFAVTFVDMRMPPGWNGLETIAHLWEVDNDIQTVICTAYSDYAWEEVVARLGQSDRLLLLKKPFDRAEVWQLASALGEKWQLKRQDRLKLLESQRLTRELQSVNARLEQEVAERRLMEEKLREQAYHDELTGLPNRSFLSEFIASCVARANEQENFLYAVLFLDIDNFKIINDSMGHEAGDRILIEIAERLVQVLRSSDLVTRVRSDTPARLGGDEFVIVLEGLRQHSDADSVAERLLECITTPYRVGAQKISLTASIGITYGGREYGTAAAVLRDADTAMYWAKSAGKSRFAIFDPQMHSAARRRLRIENDLRRAVSERRFSLAFQPIVSSRTGRIVAAEALIRLQHPEIETRSPAEIIPVAEETGLIVPIGEWVLEEACEALKHLLELFPGGEELKMNVNVSRRQLLDNHLSERLDAILRKTGIPSRLLGLEITESAMIDDFEATLSRLSELKKKGLSLHLDDFGTGYSSLSCLHRFPLDVVKIDRAFVMSINENPDYAAIVRAIVSLAHNLRLKVTVEGVETAHQMRQIQALGCDFAQGYHLSRPLPLEGLVTLIREWVPSRFKTQELPGATTQGSLRWIRTGPIEVPA